MKLLRQRTRRRSDREGHAVIEITLLAPWIFFLFAGTVDMGFYMYALIATENAARVATEYTSSHSTYANDSSTACRYALGEMNMMPNLQNTTSCNSLPLKVVASSVTGIDGAAASSVSVTYQSRTLFPLPFLSGRLTVTRVVQMRLRDS